MHHCVSVLFLYNKLSLLKFGGETMNMNKKTSVKKNVKFEYYRIYLVSEKQEDKPFDFLDWVELMGNKESSEKLIRYNIDYIRLDEVDLKSVGKNEFGLLHFSRLKESSFPGVGTLENSEVTEVPLTDNEYLSEDVSILFDPLNSVLMVQRNINSLSPTALGQYISFFWNENYPNEHLELRPILEKNPFEKALTKDKYKKITVRTSNYKNISEEKGFSPFKKAFDALKVYNSIDIEISLSMARTRKNGLAYKEMQEAIESLKKNQMDFDKIEIKGTEIEDTKVEKMDLLNGKIESLNLFEIPLRSSLKHSVVQEKMIEIYSPLYDNKKSEIDEILI